MFFLHRDIEENSELVVTLEVENLSLVSEIAWTFFALFFLLLFFFSSLVLISPADFNGGS